MILAIDVGNTNITLGVYRDDRLSLTARFATEAHRTADQYTVDLNNLLALYGVKREEIHGAAISSVVPSVSAAMHRAVNRLFGVEPVIIGPGVKTGLNIRIDNPAQLGADLVAGCVGALAKYPLPCIVFDLGTAATASVLDRSGTMIGGVIAAGPVTTMNALATNTAQLPFIDLGTAQKKVIGTNTVDCIRSGLIIGAAAMLDGLADRIEEELGESTTVVATGGLAPQVTAYCKRKIILDDNLLLDGLIQVYRRNGK